MKTKNISDHTAAQIDALNSDASLPADLDKALKYVKDTFGGSNDLIIREFWIKNLSDHRAAVIYIDG